MVHGTLARAAGLITALLVGLSGQAMAAPPGQPAPPPDVDVRVDRPAAAAPADVPAADRAAVLGAGWESSTDRAWTVSGDADGLHVFLADAARGYAWTELTTLSERGFEADRWIGNACVTGSGRRMVVVYAPRTFTNESELFDRGGFTAVVDLDSGEVTKLPVQTSLAYFNPACGVGDEAVLTQGGDEDLGRTRLLRVDTAAAGDRMVGATIEVPGQLTSAVPTAHGLVAADRGALVLVGDDGSRRVAAATEGVPFALAADADGGVVYLERSGSDQAIARRADLAPLAARGRAHVVTLATGGLTEMNVASGRGGRVFITGESKRPVHGTAPRGVSVVDQPVGTQFSTEGGLAVTAVSTVGMPGAGGAAAVQVDATVLSTGRRTSFTATPRRLAGPPTAEDSGRTLSPALPEMSIEGVPNDPADFAERYCSVPRSDPRNQAMQPKPRQVEWAVDQAVRNVLTVTRPANWKNLGMPEYTPQGLFPPISLVGGGYVPAQVMLGVAAQESNLWQAARFAVPGVTANPLIGNYYGVDIYNGTPSDDWTINWAEADCGYGVTQVTDGMRLAGKEKPGETAMPYQTQRAVGLDFAANIAAGLRILQQKWNETRSAGMIINNGNSAKIENWFYAVWAYNSGFHPQSQAGQHNGAWGVGWANNPANPRYPANRLPFLEYTYADAANPQRWPYPEKVMGWAGHPVEVLEAPNTLVAGFRPAWWNGDAVTGPANRAAVKPPVNQFCDLSNNCVPGALYLPNDPSVIGEPAGPCAHRSPTGLYDLKCWYHQSSTWKSDCNYSCGNELLRFDPGYAYQIDGTAYPPLCTLTGLPSNARIIDDVPDGVPSIRPDCPRTWSNAGTFTLNYRADPDGTYPGKIDTHQIGGGFGGHFWFTHTRTANAEGGRLTVDAVWRLGTSHNGPMQVFVALPDHGAHTMLANYVVSTANGDRTRLIHQPGSGNRWVSLGAFMFNNIPQVRLSSVTADGDGSEDIAFDAVAFVPINGTYQEHSVESVAVFDEDQNIDTSAPSWLAGPLANRQELYNWATSRTSQILALPSCPASGDCLTSSMRAMVQRWRDEVLAAGTDPVNHPDGNSIASWIGFANSYLDRPTGSSRPAHFNDDLRYKIRTKATVSFVVANGKIVPGSEYAEYAHRTANTHLPRFFQDMIATVASTYGISRPNLSYRIADLNLHNGAYTSANPGVDGILPGRAYAYAGKVPVLVDPAGVPSQSNGVCVAALTVAGGSIGYRPMLGEDGPVDGMADWVGQLSGSVAVPQLVADLAEDVRELFFDAGPLTGLESSMFTQAPPIWQELNIKVCADGTLQQVSGRPILRASHMPDHYLYYDGQAVNQSGSRTFSNQPIMRGDFHAFSAMPEPNQQYPLYPNPFGPCDFATDRSGNPWDITAVPPGDPGTNPDNGHFCVDKSIPRDASHSA